MSSRSCLSAPERYSRGRGKRAGLSELLIEKGVLSRDEIEDRMRRIGEAP